ncbi:MAG: hypothetical protein NZ898_12385 [Myxococcota bacterium]|nr:hypothetical protein [Myxococcota bacterium]MDW8361050.1 hypothetical protein [Myxococcales bacterium]
MTEGSRARSPHWPWIVLLSGVAGWLVGWPGVERLTGWFYRPLGAQPLSPSPVALPLLALAVGCAVAAWRALGRRRRAIALALLVGGNVMAQGAMLALDRTAFARRVEEGHGLWLRIARERRGQLLATLRDYESLAGAGALGAFAPSKPPGTFAFYAALDAIGSRPLAARVARGIGAALDLRLPTSGLPDAAHGALLVFPLLTALTLVPVFLAARRLTGSEPLAFAACILTGSNPGLLLIDMHTDGSLFALLAATAFASAVTGLGARSAASATVWLAIAGALLGVGLWTTFSLLPMAALLGLLVALHGARRGARRLAPEWSDRGMRLFVLGASTLAVVLLLWGVDLSPDPLQRMRVALDYHARWKGGLVGGWHGLIALVEYWLWAGLVVLALLAARIGLALRRTSMRSRTLADHAVIALVATHLATALQSGSVEVARLWLWQTPLLATVVATGPLLPPRPSAVLAVGCAQLVTACVMKACQPW